MKHLRLLHGLLAPRSILLFVLAGTTLAGGCTGTIIREGAGAVTGAKGTFSPIQPLSDNPEARPLGSYQRFEIGTFTDEMGGLVPPQILSDLPVKFQEYLLKEKVPNQPTGRTLVLKGKVLHYEGATTLGKVVGPIEEVVARVEMVDKESGTVLAVANCVGRTKTRVNLGIDKKTEGLAKALASWISERYPEEQKIKKE